MFPVPETNDNVNKPSSDEITKSLTQSEITTKSSNSPLPLSSSEVLSPSENDEKFLNTTQIEQSPSSTPKQHLSRLTHFHQNTIHVCDQNGNRATLNEQHHSAPPSHNQQTRIGLDAIHETGEYLTTNEQEQEQQNLINSRFPRSSTVPYSSYPFLRQSGGYSLPPLNYYFTDNGTSIQGTVSPVQFNPYIHTRQPFSSINTNFQPISPQHRHNYNTRPVDILKPTFLIVSKEVEQKLSAQLSASNSSIPPFSTKETKLMTKKSQKRTKKSEESPSIVRNVEVQTVDESPTRPTTDIGLQHIGLVATPNPSPYVHFANALYPRECPSEPTVIENEFTNIKVCNQPSSTIRSMPNIALTQGHYYISQEPIDDQQQQQILSTIDTTGVRPVTAPQMMRMRNNRIRMETGETDESSVASIDFPHPDFVDIPGSWRYHSAPVRTVARRYRPPIPQSFYDSQQYVSDSEQIVRSSSYRQPQLYGSIPTINRPFDSIRSHQTMQWTPSMRLNEKDVLKIASFYKSIGTLVYVAHSIATLYTCDFDGMANLKDWKVLYTGVPVWLFNTGMNPKRARSIRLIIAELGSSFTLWDTIVNGGSDVRLPKPRHITLKSLETGAILALKFEDASATDEFHQYFVKLSCDPRNADLFDIFNPKRHRPSFILRKKKIKKSAISKPSHFNHITKVDEHDRDSLYTFSVLVDD